MLKESVTLVNKPGQIILPLLDLSSLYIVGYADASFANNRDLSSQLGYVVLLKDKNNRAAIVNYGSWKCRRVTRSVLELKFMHSHMSLDFFLAVSQDLNQY